MTQDRDGQLHVTPGPVANHPGVIRGQVWEAYSLRIRKSGIRLKLDDVASLELGKSSRLSAISDNIFLLLILVAVFSVTAEIILPDTASSHYSKHWAHFKTH